MKSLPRLLWLLCLVSWSLVSCTNVLREKIEAEKNARKSGDILLLAQGRIQPKMPYAKTFVYYEAIREALASDRLARLPDLSDRFVQHLSTVNASTDLIERVRALKANQPEEELRTLFGDVSQSMIAHYKKVGAQGLQAYRCPMAKRYPDWIQPKSLQIANPYMGQRMIACGFPIEMDETKP